MELLFLAMAHLPATLENAASVQKDLNCSVEDITGVDSDDDLDGVADTVSTNTGEQDSIPQVINFETNV